MKPDHASFDSLNGCICVPNQQACASVLMGVFCLLLFAQTSQLESAPNKKLDARWSEFSTTESLSIDHQNWQSFLDKYLLFDEKGQSFMAYNKVSTKDKIALNNYLTYLSQLPPKVLTLKQQMAYWINLYNAQTAVLILDNYPVKSIRKLGKSWFKLGPWDDKLLTINGIKLSLNDIEHRILRPIYQQASLHYGLNCASISCPNLSATAFTSKNAQTLLAQGARHYVNHSRGVRFNDDDELVLSSIYKWYKEDFGVSYIDLLTHLIGYANKPLGDKLRAYKGPINYQYNWDLNELKPAD